MAAPPIYTGTYPTSERTGKTTMRVLTTGTARSSRPTRLTVAAVAVGMSLLTACGGAKVGGSGSGSSSSSSGSTGSSAAASTGAAGSSAPTGGATKACGSFNLADNAWVGYESDVAVLTYLAKTKLNCTVNIKHVSAPVAWQGFASGQIDAIVENWGHPDFVKQYITQGKQAVDLGPDGMQGIIGWYLPPWMAKKYPDITDWKNLNKYASMFKTSESGSKGQLLDGDPSYQTNDAALVKNLNLNYKVVVGGSETALIQSFRKAEQNKTPILAYFYSPQWFLNEVPLVKVNLPKNTPGCDAVPAKVACDYAPYVLNKVVSTKFANSGSPALQLIKNFKWTNKGQNEVAKDIAVNKLSDDAAAKKYIDANPDVVKAWLAGT